MKIVKSIINPLLDFIYPPVCIFCHTLLPDSNQKLCRICWNNIPTLSKSHPLYQETHSRLISEGWIDDLLSCYVFEKDGPFQQIVHALKYQEYTSLGVDLGKKIGRLTQELQMKIDVLIPVPLHRIKQRERGYNQSEFIARGIAAVINRPIMLNAVRRSRQTKTQTSLNLEERRKNMEGAFELVGGSIKNLQGKRCLLVDDVITTGATANSCAKEIMSAGVRSIIATSAALAQ